MNRAASPLAPCPTLPLTALVLRLDRFRLGLRVDLVNEVTHMVTVSPLLGASGVVRGTIDYRGTFATVLDLRPRLVGVAGTLPPDMFLAPLTIDGHVVALAFDEVVGVRRCSYASPARSSTR